MTTRTTKKAEVQTKEPPVITGKINLNVINQTKGFTSRVQSSRKRYTETQSKVSSDRPWYMMQSYKETEGQHPYLRAARRNKTSDLRHEHDNRGLAYIG